MTDDDAGRGTRATVFAVGGVDYAVTGRVVRSLPAVHPLPSGVLHGGREFPLVDLRAGFGVEAEDAAGRLVLLIDQGDLRRALVADEVIGTVVFDPAAVQSVPAVYPEAERERWQGLVLRPDDRLLALLRLEGLPTAVERHPGGGG